MTGPSYPDGYTFTYADMTDGSMELTDLLLGDYTVTETNANLAGYTVTTTYQVAAEAETTSQATVTLTDDSELVITVKNTYTKIQGSLIVAKSFPDDVLTDEQKNGITFTITGPSYPDGYSFTYEQMTNGNMVFGALDPGTYTFCVQSPRARIFFPSA